MCKHCAVLTGYCNSATCRFNNNVISKDEYCYCYCYCANSLHCAVFTGYCYSATCRAAIHKHAHKNTRSEDENVDLDLVIVFVYAIVYVISDAIVSYSFCTDSAHFQVKMKLCILMEMKKESCGDFI